jgi:hypothetical protein
MEAQRCVPLSSSEGPVPTTCNRAQIEMNAILANGGELGNLSRRKCRAWGSSPEKAHGIGPVPVEYFFLVFHCTIAQY